MSGFKTNMAAMNAARKQFGKDWKASAKVEKLDGEWYVQLLQIEPVASLPEVVLIGSPVQSVPGWDKVDGGAFTAEEHDAQGHCQGHHNASSAQEQMDAAKRFDEDNYDPDMHAAQQAADRIANAQASEQNLPNGKVWIRMSTALKPTKLVWAIADEMIAMAENEAEESGKPVEYPSRSAVQAECVNRGIASGTARTQYQAWKKARDNDIANAKHAAELSKKFNGN